MSSDSRRALLVFAKAPVPGRVKTRLAAARGSAEACRLYRAFLADVGHLAADLARRPGTAVEWWVDGDPAALAPFVAGAATCHRQRGVDLGARLATALAAAHKRHPGPVQVIGSDCPHLGAARVDELFDAVAAGVDAALVPVEDGGYAAIALARPHPEVFQDIPWSTPAVLATTLERLRGRGLTWHLTEPLYDVDTERDLERLARELAGHPQRAPHSAAALTGGGAP